LNLGSIKYRLKLEAMRYGDLYPYRRYMTKNKCIFIHVPKAAGTSVLQALHGKNVHIQRDHCEIQAFRSACKPFYQSYYKFTFVRHPVDRIYSSYRYLLGGGNKMNNNNLPKLLNEKYPNFNDFVKLYLDEDRIRTIFLFRPQFTFFCNENFEPLVDFIGRYESINDDFEVVKDKLKLKRGLPLVNVSEVKEKVDIDDEAKEKIYNLYKKDFEVLKYDL